ncbi:MAG: glycosyltransferase [Patescibacteria group bacterium]|jgi:glycosyltransferase involved in cell wall biosynthesis
MPLTLSVVIPTKNEEQYLPSILAELREQSLQPIEVIVSDANSTDATRAIAEKFGAKVVDGGLPSAGRNRGAEVATGDLIYFFDADVILRDKNFLVHAVEEFERKTFDVAAPRIGVVDAKAFDRFTHAFYNGYIRLIQSFLPHLPGFCILVRRSLHEAIGGFDESVLFCEDCDYAIRSAKKGKFGILDSVEILVTTRRQERDGRLSMTIKYILAEFHIIFLGPIRHDKFKYGFGYDVKKSKE